MVELNRVLFPEVIQKRSRGHTMARCSSQVLCIGGVDSLANLGAIHAATTGRRPKRSREVPKQGRKTEFQELSEVPKSMDTLASITYCPPKKTSKSIDQKKSVAKKTRRSKRDRATKNVKKSSIDKSVHPHRRGLRSTASNRPPDTAITSGMGLASMFGIQVVPSRKIAVDLKESKNDTVTMTRSPSPIEKDCRPEMVEELSVVIPNFVCDSPPRLTEPPLEESTIQESKQMMTEAMSTEGASPIKIPKTIIMREAVTQTDFDWDASNELSIHVPAAQSPHVVPLQELDQLSPVEKLNTEEPVENMGLERSTKKEKGKSGGSRRQSRRHQDQTTMTPTNACTDTSIHEDLAPKETTTKSECQDRITRRSKRLSTQEANRESPKTMNSSSMEELPASNDVSAVKSATRSNGGKRGKKRKSGVIPKDKSMPSRDTSSKQLRRSRRTTAPPERLGIDDNEMETQPLKIVEKSHSAKKEPSTTFSNLSGHDESCIQPRRSRRTAAPPERLGVYDNEAENLPTDTVEASRSPKKEAKATGISPHIDEDGWNQRELALLRDAHQRVEPTSQLFWEQVSAEVESKSASECREKWFSLAKTPMLQSKKGKRVLSPKGGTPIGAVDDIFNATPMKALFQLPAKNKNDTTKERGGPASFLLNMDFGSAIKVSKPQTDCSSGGPSPANRGYKTYINRVKRDIKKSNKRPNKNIPHMRKRQITFWDSEGDAAIKGQLSPGGTVRVCVEAGLHDEDGCFSSEEDECGTIETTF